MFSTNNYQFIKNFTYTSQVVIDFIPREKWGINFYVNTTGQLFAKFEKNYLTSNTSLGLQFRWNKQHPKNKCLLLDGDEFLKSTRLKHLNANDEGTTRIYVIAHTIPGADYFLDKNGQKINLDELAQRLADFIGKKEAVVNLISCGAGMGGKNDSVGQTSAAARLHAMLVSKLNKNVSVIARMQVVDTLITVSRMGLDDKYDPPKLEKKLTVNLKYSWEDTENDQALKKVDKDYLMHQQPGSKVCFSVDSEGNQIKFDMYYHLWKKKVLKTLANARDHTRVVAKKKFLENWLNEFKNLSTDEIFEKMSLEINKPDTVLKKHSCIISALFKNAATFEKVNALLTEIKKINSSPYTFKTIIQTERKIN